MRCVGCRGRGDIGFGDFGVCRGVNADSAIGRGVFDAGRLTVLRSYIGFEMGLDWVYFPTTSRKVKWISHFRKRAYG